MVCLAGKTLAFLAIWHVIRLRKIDVSERCRADEDALASARLEGQISCHRQRSPVWVTRHCSEKETEHFHG
jgi:hypothetical protein